MSDPSISIPASQRPPRTFARDAGNLQLSTTSGSTEREGCKGQVESAPFRSSKRFTHGESAGHICFRIRLRLPIRHPAGI